MNGNQRHREITYLNTMLLLKNYRAITWMLESLLKSDNYEYNDAIYNVNNGMLNIQKMKELVEKVNDALFFLKQKPGDGEYLFELINLSYIVPESRTHDELLHCLNISSRQYYRMREHSINILSLKLWSVPSKDSEYWYEMLIWLDQML